MAAAPALQSTSLQRLQDCLNSADYKGMTPVRQAAQAAREAMALALQMGDTCAHLQARTSLCVQLFRIGRYAEVVQTAPAALATMRAHPQPHEIATERRDLTRAFVLSSCEVGSFGPAVEAANELAQVCASEEDADGAMTAALCLSSCSERMGDSWQALKILRQAVERFGERAGMRCLLQCSVGLAATCIGLFHRLSGVADPDEIARVLDEGEAANRRALTLIQAHPEPAGEIAVFGNLGELLLYQGQAAEAELWLKCALEKAQAQGMSAYAWRVRATLGAWLLKHGQPAQARSEMQALLQEMGEAAPQPTAIRVHHTAYAACKQLGLAEEALLHFEHVERFERRRAVSQLRAQSEHFVTRAEAQRADFLAEQSRLEALRQRALAQEQAHKAEQDALTQLGNRRLVLRRWPELLAAQGGTEGSEASHSVLALALIDIDHFKRVNDCFGHAAGDQVLVELAGLLRQHTRSTDVLARHGGEEFLVLFPGLSMPEAEEACDRLRVCVNAYDWSPVLGVERSITISIGLAAAPPLELNALVQLADEALYRAKHSGRDRVCCQPLAA